MKITSTLFLLSIGFTVFGKPNVLIIMTDDQGYPEISAHGNPVLQTPNLDRLHGQSLRLSDYHVAPMCTPTRGQLLTGLDAARNGAVNVSSGRALIGRKSPSWQIILETRVIRLGFSESGTLGPTIPTVHRTAVFRKVCGIHPPPSLRFLPIGETIILTMSTCTTGRKNSLRAIAPTSSLMRQNAS